MIQYTGAIPRLNAVYGQGLGPVLFDDMRCTGLEQRLYDCHHPGFEVENCGHHQDAGVECRIGIHMYYNSSIGY